jgi:hypothetical protein
MRKSWFQLATQTLQSGAKGQNFYPYRKHDFFKIHNFLRDDPKIVLPVSGSYLQAQGIPSPSPPYALLTTLFFVKMSL